MDAIDAPETIKKIRELNDAFRRTFQGGRVMLTTGVAALDDARREMVLAAIRTFESFDEANDPYGEHDMVFVTVEGTQYWAKIDYYDTDIRYLSDDPSNPKVTRRVMTIGAPGEF